MSLFKLQELWSTKCGQNEQFDANCLHISNIDNSENNTDKIIVGGHSGNLRIYALAKSSNASANELILDVNSFSYSDNHLLLESQFPNPILQVSSGILLSASDKIQLAILFPKKLSIFSVSSTEGISKFGFAYTLNLLYEHELPRFAFNMLIANFGHVRGRDFICVQSLDGALMFFEQEITSFVRSLPSFLLPSDFTYLGNSDAFLIQNAEWTLQCFRYQVLALSSNPKEDEAGQGMRKATPDWHIELGQSALQMQYVKSDSGGLVCVLCELYLYILRENGHIVWQKKLDVPAIYMHCYNLNTEKAVDFARTMEARLMIAVLNEMDSLCIFGERRLKWAATLPFHACCVQKIKVTSQGALSGCLCLLSDEGELAVTYVGTSPSLQLVSTLDKKRKEMRERRSKHKQSNEENPVEEELTEQTFDVSGDLRKLLTSRDEDFNALMRLDGEEISGNVPQPEECQFRVKTIELRVLRGQLMSENHDIRQWIQSLITLNADQVTMFDIYVQIHAITACEQVTIRIIGEGLHIHPESHTWSSISIGDKIEISFRVHLDCNNFSFVASEPLKLLLSYLNGSGSQRQLFLNVPMPLITLCTFSSSNVISNENSIQFEFTSQPRKYDLRLLLEELFDTKAIPNQRSNQQWTDTWPTLKADKVCIRCGTSINPGGTENDNLVEVQLKAIENQSSETRCIIKILGTENISNIFVVFIILEKLEKYFEEGIIKSFHFNESFLQLNYYFSLVEKQLNIRKKLHDCREKLEQLCEKYRVIDKRLLIKLKERNLGNLSNLSMLLEFFYNKTMTCSEQITESETELLNVGSHINFHGHLLLKIIKLNSTISQDQLVSLESIFTLPKSSVACHIEGWQESSEQSLAFELNKGSRQNTKSYQSSISGLPESIENFKKLVIALLENMLNITISNTKSQLKAKPSLIIEED